MTEKKVESEFTQHDKKYTQAFQKIILSPSIQSGKVTLRQVIEKKQLGSPDKIIEGLCHHIEELIFASFEFYALAMYRVMERKNDWTDAGQDRVKLSFLRLLLSIPTDQDISFSDYSRFDQILTEKNKTYQIDSFSADELEFKVKYPEIHVLGILYRSTDTALLNRLLEIVESSRRVMMGSAGTWRSFLMGVAGTKKIAGYSIHFFKTEEMRTPNNVHYIVGVIEQKDIAIRQEVCEYVFYNKWVPIFDGDLFQIEAMQADAPQDIAEAIKRQFADLLGVGDRDEMITKKDQFIELMMENLVYHEVAHDALESSLSDMEMTFMDGLTSQEETILSVMTEILTELQIEHQGVKGPLKNIVDVAITEGNELKAKQLLFIYLSDAWFYDTDTTFMYPYTDILFTCLLSYLGPKGEVDFARLYKDLPEIYKFLSKWYRDSVADIYVKIKQIKTQKDGKDVTFGSIEKNVRNNIALFRGLKELEPLNGKDEQGNFWINFFSYLKSKHPAELASLLDAVRQKESELSRLLLTKYGNNTSKDTLREYVQFRMQELGYGLREL